MADPIAMPIFMLYGLSLFMLRQLSYSPDTSFGR